MVEKPGESNPLGSQRGPPCQVDLSSRMVGCSRKDHVAVKLALLKGRMNFMNFWRASAFSADSLALFWGFPEGRVFISTCAPDSELGVVVRDMLAGAIPGIEGGAVSRTGCRKRSTKSRVCLATLLKIVHSLP